MINVFARVFGWLAALPYVIVAFVVLTGDGTTYASRTGARLVEVDAGHFAMLVRSELVERELRKFVQITLAR